MDAASRKVLCGRNPRPLEPGVYPVVLEPCAVGDIVYRWDGGRDGRRRGAELDDRAGGRGDNRLKSPVARDGTFLIERGEITVPVKNLRFTQSYVEVLANVEMVRREIHRQRPDFDVVRAPALKISAFLRVQRNFEIGPT